MWRGYIIQLSILELFDNMNLTEEFNFLRKIVLFVLLFVLILCLFGCDRKHETDKPTATDNLTIIDTKGDTEMEYIWNLTDTNDFVIAMTGYLNEKTQYGEDMSLLSDAERIFYITQTLEMEVNNGGFSQFFYNSSGDFSNELVGAFTATQLLLFVKKQSMLSVVIFLLTGMNVKNCWISWKAINLMRLLRNVMMHSLHMKMT